MTKSVFAIALNHKSQMQHWHDAFLQDPYKKLPVKQVWFIKPRNTYNVSGGTINLTGPETYYSGATLALIIGKKASKIKSSEYTKYLKGIALANEISLEESSFYRPAIKAKCQDGSCPIGSIRDLKDIRHITLNTYINDTLVQSDSTDDLILDAGAILESLTDFATLQENDVVLVGTSHKRVAIKPLDKIEIKACGFETLVTYAK